MNPSDKNADPLGTELTEEDRLRASRRAAILSGLGKGSAALVAMSPLASHATRTHKIANANALPGGFGYCSVSGFQSAAISGSPAPVVCSAFTPGHFLQVTPLDYNAIEALPPTGGGNYNTRLAARLCTVFSLPANTITSAGIQATIRASSPVKLVVTGHNLIILPISTTSGTGLRPQSFGGISNSLVAFNSSTAPGFFTNSGDGRLLLEVLYDWVVATTPASGNCFFLAAFLTRYINAGLVPSGFDTTYIKSTYTATGYNSSTNEYKFYKALCVTP